MTKYKDLPNDEKGFVDYYQMRFIRLISFASFLGLGLWMLLSPEKPEHQSIEKSSLYLFKELWGIPFGIILLSIGVVGVAYFLYQIIGLKKFAWIKFTTGYYLFEEKKRLSGLNAIYHNDDLIVFYPEKNKVLNMASYTKANYNEYKPAKLSKEFNNDEIYWSADENGYAIIYKGKSLLNTTSEWKGDDLLVKSQEKYISILLKDYKNSKESKIRTAKLAN